MPRTVSDFLQRADLILVLHQGRIVYQLGADLRLYTLAGGADQLIPITLASDFEHTRERWINTPWNYLSAVHVAPEGIPLPKKMRPRPPGPQVPHQLAFRA